MKKLPKVKTFPSSEHGMFVDNYSFFKHGKQIPFSQHKGKILTFERPNQPFKARLKFIKTVVIHKTHKVLWEDDQGYSYIMFIPDLDDVMKVGLEPGGFIEGEWMVRKTSSSYGLIMLTDEYQK